MPPRRVIRATQPRINGALPVFPNYQAETNNAITRAIERYPDPFTDDIFSRNEYFENENLMINARNKINTLRDNNRINAIREASENLRRVTYFDKVIRRIANNIERSIRRGDYFGNNNIANQHMDQANVLVNAAVISLTQASRRLRDLIEIPDQVNAGVENISSDEEDEEYDSDEEYEDEIPIQTIPAPIQSDQINYINNIAENCNGETISPFSLEELQPGNTILIDGKCYDKNDIVNYYNSFLTPNGTFSRPFISPFTRQPYSQQDIAIIRAIKESLPQGGYKRRKTKRNKSNKSNKANKANKAKSKKTKI